MSRIISDNIEATDVIRPAVILAAREAIDRGAYDAPGIFDTALDNMIDRAESDQRMQEAFEQLADEEMQRQCETDR